MRCSCGIVCDAESVRKQTSLVPGRNDLQPVPCCGGLYKSIFSGIAALTSTVARAASPQKHHRVHKQCEIDAANWIDDVAPRVGQNTRSRCRAARPGRIAARQHDDAAGMASTSPKQAPPCALGRVNAGTLTLMLPWSEPLAFAPCRPWLHETARVYPRASCGSWAKEHHCSCTVRHGQPGQHSGDDDDGGDGDNCLPRAGAGR